MCAQSLYVYELNWMTELSTPHGEVLQLIEEMLDAGVLAQIDTTVLVEKLLRLALREDSLISGSAIAGLVHLEAWDALRQLVHIWLDPRKQLQKCSYPESYRLLLAYERAPTTALLELEYNLTRALQSTDTDPLWPAVRSYFRRKDTAIRQRAIRLTGKLHIKAAVNSLKRIIADIEQEAWHPDAIEALGYIGDARAVRYLLTLLEHADYGQEVLWALQVAKSPQAIPALKKLWATSPSPAICSVLIDTLGAIGGDKATRLLLQYFNGPYTTSIIAALGQTGSDIAVPRLSKLLRSRNATQTARDLAAQALSQINSPAARKALADALAHGNKKAASSAGTALQSRQTHLD